MIRLLKRRLGPALAIALVCCSIHAAQVVVFVDGRTLEVSQVVLRGATAQLALEGGGRIGVPASRLSNLDELEVSTGFNDSRREEPIRQIDSDPAWRDAAGNYADLIHRTAVRHDLDPALLTSMAIVESGFDPRAVSRKGAQGLMQLIPATAVRFGVEDVFDPSQNLDGGARYLQWLLERYEGSTELALAGYNAGEAAVDRYGGIPPYRETQAYVRRILDGTRQLTGESGAERPLSH